MTTKHYLLILPLLALLASCGGDEQEQNTIDKEVFDPISTLNTVFDGKIFSIPSPVQTAYLIKQFDLSFDASLLNDDKNATSYVSEYQQALHLGLYGTDLGYSTYSIGSDKYKALKKHYINESLSDLTTNRLEENKIILLNNKLYQNDDPIYHDPKGTPFLEAHFYAPYKYIFGKKYDTYTINLLAIWVISIITYIILYFDLKRKLVELFSVIGQRLKAKKGTT